MSKKDASEGRRVSFIKRINSLKKTPSIALEVGMAELDIEYARKWERRWDGDGVESEDEDASRGLALRAGGRAWGDR